MDEALTGFGRGWYNGAVALGDAAQQTAIRYATDPNAIVEASIAIQEAPIRALAGGAVAMAALSQADSDLVVLYLSEAAAGEFREALERDAEAWGELTAKGSPTVVMALGGELLWASKAAGRSAQLIDAGEDLSKWLARQESTAVAKQSSAILKRDFETLAPHRGFWADYTRNETLRPGCTAPMGIAVLISENSSR